MALYGSDSHEAMDNTLIWLQDVHMTGSVLTDGVHSNSRGNYVNSAC